MTRSNRLATALAAALLLAAPGQALIAANPFAPPPPAPPPPAAADAADAGTDMIQALLNRLTELEAQLQTNEVELPRVHEDVLTDLDPQRSAGPERRPVLIGKVNDRYLLQIETDDKVKTFVSVGAEEFAAHYREQLREFRIIAGDAFQ